MLFYHIILQFSGLYNWLHNGIISVTWIFNFFSQQNPWQDFSFLNQRMRKNSTATMWNLKNFPRVYPGTPDPHLQGRGKEWRWEGEKEKGGKERLEEKEGEQRWILCPQPRPSATAYECTRSFSCSVWITHQRFSRQTFYWPPFHRGLTRNIGKFRL
jgi:hypothetical protein